MKCNTESSPARAQPPPADAPDPGSCPTPRTPGSPARARRPPPTRAARRAAAAPSPAAAQSGCGRARAGTWPACAAARGPCAARARGRCTPPRSARTGLRRATQAEGRRAAELQWQLTIGSVLTRPHGAPSPGDVRCLAGSKAGGAGDVRLALQRRCHRVLGQRSWTGRGKGEGRGATPATRKQAAPSCRPRQASSAKGARPAPPTTRLGRKRIMSRGAGGPRFARRGPSELAVGPRRAPTSARLASDASRNCASLAKPAARARGQHLHTSHGAWHRCVLAASEYARLRGQSKQGSNNQSEQNHRRACLHVRTRK